MEFENFDVDSIDTPVKAEIFTKLLKQSGYDANKTEYLLDGFKNGFSLEFEGNLNETTEAPNLKFMVGDKVELWNKVMSEVRDKHFAGPFKKEQLPFISFIQSRIGLVPKDNGTKTRLIFHLSFPKCTEHSVNANIPKEKCTVKYNDFDQAMVRCIEEEISCKIGKSDMV